MSSALAIAAVTSTLQNLLSNAFNDAAGELAGTSVTVKPLDKARGNENAGNQLNVFLYATEINGAWRNLDPPDRVRRLESGHPPLALNLFYILTAYGQADNDVAAHRVLGQAMATLHDHPLLGRNELRNALAESLVHEQLERVRITPESLSLDDMHKLWASFQTQYRPSAAYQLAVVLIDSARAPLAPLPVLARGEGDRGVAAQPDLVPPFPALRSVELPGRQPAARLGDAVAFAGHHLGADAARLSFRHPRLADPLELPAGEGSTDQALRVTLPGDAPGAWAAGTWFVSAILDRAGEPERTTNEVALPLAPQIAQAVPQDVGEGRIRLTVTCGPPRVRADQRVGLLFGDRLVTPSPFADGTDTLRFVLHEPASGDHWIRLRIDGVDSLLVDRSTTPPRFDPTQKVTIP